MTGEPDGCDISNLHVQVGFSNTLVK
jgi:hypothetical protein